MIKVSSKTEVKGRKRYERVRRISRLNGADVQIGVKKDATYPDGTLVWHVALWNEYGTEVEGKVRVPERSFIRSTMAENRALINGWRRDLIKKMMTDNWGEQMVLDTLGYRIAELIKAKILSNVPPENAESTKERKRRLDVPLRTLVETQRLHDSVTHRVTIPAVHEPPVKL